MIQGRRRYISGRELIKLNDVNVYYGDSHVLYDVNFGLNDGSVLALLGRNGAGKTTCIKSIIGFTPPRTGKIYFQGNEINTMPPEKICRCGIGLVPQGRRIFASLTVYENLLVAKSKPKPSHEQSWDVERVYRIFPRLKERHNQLAGNLSGGEQQMLAIGRALMTNPKLLLLDEPSEGLAPQIVNGLGKIISSLKESLSIILVEQNLKFALNLCDDVVILNNGRVLFAGEKREYEEQDKALKPYLGIE